VEQRWQVRGDLCIGFFALQDIAAGEELTYDYNFERYGEQTMRCMCGTKTCRGQIGGVEQVRREEAGREGRPTACERAHLTATEKLRIERTGFGAGRQKIPLNDGQIPNFRGIRVALGTGYNRVEGYRRETDVSDLPAETCRLSLSRVPPQEQYEPVDIARWDEELDPEPVFMRAEGEENTVAELRQEQWERQVGFSMGSLQGLNRDGSGALVCRTWG
jgi:hypothetical protein